jgi:drug/metabolite transporter (DMT)-like permease
MVAIAGVWFLQERVTRREMLGIGIALAGTIVTVAGPVLQNGDGETGLTGNLLVFASLLVGVATAVIGKVLLRRELSPIFLTNLSFVVGFLTVLPIALFFYRPFEIWNLIIDTSPAYHAGVLYMALLSGTLAYWLWHKAQKTIEIGEGGLFAYLYPIIGAPLAVFWLGEKITMPFIVGAVIIAFGVIIAEYKKTRYNN